MDSSEANSRECQRQAIDAELKSLEESIQKSFRALRRCRNALAPISSLPTEVIAAIFSIFRSFDAPLAGGKRDHLAWLRVTHVCHQWREIALNNPIFWSHIDFTNITLAGVAEMLSRAKKAPLRLEARVTGHRREGARFSAFKKELQSHVSDICYLTIKADSVLLCRTLKRLASPAPTLERLSLFMDANYQLRTPSQAPIPDTLFGGTTPRLSCLELRKCNINWKSPLLKGLRHLEIRSPSERARPSLTDWLDALDEMPQLRELILDSASPIVPPSPFDIKRTITLPFLTQLDISASVGDCALALSHLALPVLTHLWINAKSVLLSGSDVLKSLPYFVQHSHGPQDMQPLQYVLIRGERKRMEILAWPDIYAKAYDFPFVLATLLYTPRVALSFTCRVWLADTHIELLSAAIVALPLDNISRLTACDRLQLDEEFWRHHAPRFPLLQCMHLPPPAARGFREMILQDNGELERPPLPSLTILDLPDSALSKRRTLRLCDALKKRKEQGVPVEELDLRSCRATSYAVQLLSEVVDSVRSPEAPDLVTSRRFIPDDEYRAEDFSDADNESEPYYTSDDVEEDVEIVDDEEEDDGEMEGV
ncbi:hypothetical protein V8E53_004135 [Lactarius tabidus]